MTLLWLSAVPLLLASCATTPVPATPQAAAITNNPTRPELPSLPEVATPTPLATIVQPPTPVNPTPTTQPQPTETKTALSTPEPLILFGHSSNGYPLEAHRLGNGPRPVIIVGGIHGGYEWNTILLAYDLIYLFTENPDWIPEELTLYIVPSANPDGQVAVVGQSGPFASSSVSANTFRGRFNGRGVDLNRNWPCDWQETGFWRDETVDGGTYPLSEVETFLLNRFISNSEPELVIFLHSRLPAVIPGRCDGESHPLTETTARLYADTAGYPYSDSFTAYPITGDASNALNKVGIPSFTVELETRDDPETVVNLYAIRAVIDYLADNPDAN